MNNPKTRQCGNCGNGNKILENTPSFSREIKPLPHSRTPAEAAEAWLAKQSGAVSGNGGHRETMRIATTLAVGFDLSEAQLLSLLVGWNVSCSPPWSERELAHKVADACRTLAKNARGFMKPPEAPTYRRPTPQANEVRRKIVVRSAPAPTPAGLCPSCWSRRIVSPIGGPTCQCQPFTWPTWSSEQLEADRNHPSAFGK